MKKAYVSALGIMGRRHVAGLVRKGYSVDCFDPSTAAYDATRAELERQGLDDGLIRHVSGPEAGARYDVAIFSEHADLRFANVRRFLETSGAERILLEKPLSASPEEVEALPALFCEHGMAQDRVFGNFTRRAWAPVHQLKALCAGSSAVTMSVHGGAYGLGSNGVHHLDLFLFLTGDVETRVVSSVLSATGIPSGRGERFTDYGGHVVLENARGTMSNICVPDSSVAPFVIVTGDHFSAMINERTLEWELAVREESCDLPVYRCGAAYEVVESGVMDYVPMDHVSGLWADGDIDLPGLESVMVAHRLLNDALEMGGAQKPYCFT